MNHKALLAMWAMILLLVATWLYPPWIHKIKPEANALGPDDLRHPRKWASLFDERQGEPQWDAMIFGIDFGRLALVDATILAVGIGLILTLKDK
jgi:hypothetical protein